MKWTGAWVWGDYSGYDDDDDYDEGNIFGDDNDDDDVDGDDNKDNDEDGNDCVFSVSTLRQTMRPADTATWKTRPISLVRRMVVMMLMPMMMMLMMLMMTAA